MGDELMGASFSNPLGHVEDMPVVRLHDKIFEINGTDWRFHNHSPLVKPHWFENYIKRYVVEKMQSNVLCGVKDPRAAFFLNNWQVAGGEGMRYILIYRHWSTAANSLLNRASRHLINGIAPISASKVNFSFWQQPGLAFDMWKATNEELLGFYQQHSEQCLLISQEAFVNDNDLLLQNAAKIGLSAQSFSRDSFEPGLMTNTVPESVYAMLSDERRNGLDATWDKLQSLADGPALSTPEVTPSLNNPAHGVFSFRAKDDTPACKPEVQFDISSLGWQEALGFIACIPHELINRDVFEALLYRPYTQSQHYQSLAKIAHKNNLFLYTKLCKMRAMQVEGKCWNISTWGVFSEAGGSWLRQEDNTLEQANPFALRSGAELSSQSAEMQGSIIQQTWDELYNHLLQLPLTELSETLELVLLYRLFNGTGEYEAITQLARQHGLSVLAEFALIKSLRLEYKAESIVALGDIYHSHNMGVKAQQCFEEAESLMPNNVAIVARLADVNIALGDMDKARRYLTRAQQLQTNHKVVKVCEKRLTQLESQQAATPVQQSAPVLQMFTMPMVGSYEEVVDLTRLDRDAGAELDAYNQRVSFILRNNKQWLEKGLAQLAPPAAECLAEKIYAHWRKLWPESVLKRNLGLESFSEPNAPQEPSSLSSKVEKPIGPLKLAVNMHIDHLDGLQVLLDFVDHIPYQADLLLSCPESIRQQAQLLSGNFTFGATYVEGLDTELAKEKEHVPLCLGGHKDRQQNYDLICRVHNRADGQHSEVVSWNLQLLFGILGTQTLVEKIIRSFVEKPELGLVVPPYHPALAETLAGEKALIDMQTSAKALSLSISPLYVYPAGGMFWYRPQALSALFDRDLDEQNSSNLASLLPAFAKQVGFKTQCSHLLKS